MFDKVKQVGKMAQLRSSAKQIQKALSKERISVEKGRVMVVVRGNQEVEEVVIDNQPQPIVVKALNEALKKSQKVAAKRMQGLASDLLGF
ncbi:YbaB/EbfC family nucleoid-associated protein [Candidatus Shapirobacteria bacterium]|nr:YbaB/EbfC family nucleoid-associated protein [Candidatus Shapirobacteria bacterium]